MPFLIGPHPYIIFFSVLAIKTILQDNVPPVPESQGKWIRSPHVAGQMRGCVFVATDAPTIQEPEELAHASYPPAKDGLTWVRICHPWE